jgi:hypothetical protein
MFNIAE